MKKRKGQVWVETVIYTLIAFIMIGLVLSFVKPKIEEMQDKVIIDQSIKMLKEIDDTIFSIRGASGNQRVIDITLEKGIINVDGVNDKIFFELTTRNEYSEPGVDINYDNLIINTQEVGNLNIVNIKRDYSGNYNITYNERDETKVITKSSRPHKIVISNKGRDSNNKIIIDMEVG
ncbi:MAG: hypothetical protein AABW81_03550 [Nanoarchaeota archaeon]